MHIDMKEPQDPVYDSGEYDEVCMRSCGRVGCIRNSEVLSSNPPIELQY